MCSSAPSFSPRPRQMLWQWVGFFFFPFFSSILTVGFGSAQAEQVAQWKGFAHSIFKLLFCKWKTKARSRMVFWSCLLPGARDSFSNINTNLPLDRKECALSPALCAALLEETVCFPDTAVHAWNPSTWDSETGGLGQILDQFGLQSQKLSRINNNKKEKKKFF